MEEGDGMPIRIRIDAAYEDTVHVENGNGSAGAIVIPMYENAKAEVNGKELYS